MYLQGPVPSFISIRSSLGCCWAPHTLVSRIGEIRRQVAVPLAVLSMFGISQMAKLEPASRNHLLDQAHVSSCLDHTFTYAVEHEEPTRGFGIQRRKKCGTALQ